MIQYRRKMIVDAQNQLWYYREDGFIYPQTNPNLVLDIRVTKICIFFMHEITFSLLGKLDKTRNSRVTLREKISRKRKPVMGFSP